jgi:hypothetical protein
MPAAVNGRRQWPVSCGSAARALGANFLPIMAPIIVVAIDGHGLHRHLGRVDAPLPHRRDGVEPQELNAPVLGFRLSMRQR